jgi:lipid II:glycine glycyltransferase (peptidoglycan interpeptide bridge formation enzyme)
MTLDLNSDDTQMLARCGPDWRRNLRRSERHKLSIRHWANPNPDEILSVYLSMQGHKGLQEQHSRSEIEQLLRNIKEQLILYRCDDEHGQLVSLGGVLVGGDRANFWLAATTERGRKLSASYPVLWELIRHCRRTGVSSLDLGGIDPVQNPGVYHFKKGTGARHVELLGEWDWGSRPWMRWIGNYAIQQRNSIRGRKRP